MKQIGFALGLFCAATAVHSESISQLKTRIDIAGIQNSIDAGDRFALSILPVKGFKNGMLGFMSATNTYPNPEYSFVECSSDSVIRNGKSTLGCRVSIKMAHVDENGAYHDTGIRVEYAIAPGDKHFRPNNSSWGNYALSDPRFLKESL